MVVSDFGSRRLEVWRSTWPVWLAVLLGLSLRLFRLGEKSLWLDEAQSLRVARAGLEMFWLGSIEQYHPPLYYLLLARWLQVGASEAWLRLSSVLMGTITIGLVYLLVLHLSNDYRWGTSAAWLAALSPLLIWYDQEVRSYALLCALGLAGLLVVVQLYRRSRLPVWLALTMVNIAILYTHYLGAFLLSLQFAVVVFYVSSRRTSPNIIAVWWAGSLLSLLAFLPWLNSPAAQKFFSLAISGRSYLALLFANRLHLSLVQIAPVGLGLAFLTPAMLAWMWGRWLENRIVPANIRRSIVQIGAGILFILLLILIVYPRGYSLKRQLVAFWPYILISFAWLWPWQRSNRFILTSVMAASLVASLVSISLVPKDDWRQAAAYITAYQDARDGIVLAPVYMGTPLGYYLGDNPLARYGANVGSVTKDLPAWLAAHPRLWLVTQAGDTHDPTGREAVQGWLNSHASMVESAGFDGGILIQLFEK
jgi:uncharacterized membrane protein